MHALASRVMIIEALPRLLPAMDADAVAHLQTESERIWNRFQNRCCRESDRTCRWRLRVIFTHDGDEHATEADRVVNGAGRVANMDELDLASGWVEHDHGRVAVDDYLRSVSNLRVYVCGDALATSPQLSPLANYEGDIVGRNIVENAKHRPDYEGMATAVYNSRACRCGTDGSRGQAEGTCRRRSCQQPAWKVLSQDLRRGRRMVQDHR